MGEAMDSPEHNTSIGDDARPFERIAQDRVAAFASDPRSPNIMRMLISGPQILDDICKEFPGLSWRPNRAHSRLLRGQGDPSAGGGGFRIVPAEKRALEKDERVSVVLMKNNTTAPLPSFEPLSLDSGEDQTKVLSLFVADRFARRAGNGIDSTLRREASLKRLRMLVSATTAALFPNASSEPLVLLHGSHAIGVGLEDSDVDVVILVPHDISRSSFFDALALRLDSAVPVRTALIPVLHAREGGTDLDILVSQMGHHVEGTLDPDAADALDGMDPISLAALNNGPRMANALKFLIPNSHVYKTALDFVRRWAKVRGIYSAKLGYLGGASWAILVAFVHRLYPEAYASRLVVLFFDTLGRWDFANMPVAVNDAFDHSTVFPANSFFSVVSPGVLKEHAVNSSASVTLATRGVLLAEIQRGFLMARPLLEVTSDVGPRSASASSVIRRHLDALCAPFDVLSEFPVFCRVDIRCVSPSSLPQETPSNAFKMYSSYVESRLKKLAVLLDDLDVVLAVRVDPRGLSSFSLSEDQSTAVFVGSFFAGVRVAPENCEECARVLRFWEQTELKAWVDQRPNAGYHYACQVYAQG